MPKTSRSQRRAVGMAMLLLAGAVAWLLLQLLTEREDRSDREEVDAARVPNSIPKRRSPTPPPKPEPLPENEAGEEPEPRRVSTAGNRIRPPILLRLPKPDPDTEPDSDRGAVALAAPDSLRVIVRAVTRRLLKSPGSNGGLAYALELLGSDAVPETGFLAAVYVGERGSAQLGHELEQGIENPAFPQDWAKALTLNYLGKPQPLRLWADWAAETLVDPKANVESVMRQARLVPRAMLDALAVRVRKHGGPVVRGRAEWLEADLRKHDDERFELFLQPRDREIRWPVDRLAPGE